MVAFIAFLLSIGIIPTADQDYTELTNQYETHVVIAETDCL